MPDAGPQLRTIAGVELMKVGDWPAKSGDFKVTRTVLADAARAFEAGVLRKPPLKLGHWDPRFEGSPALGYVDNMRLTDGGDTLVGDYVNVPATIARLIPHAWPDRSIEGLYDYRATDGTVWPFIVTSVALLGATDPAGRELRSLQDVAELYGLDAEVAASARRAVMFTVRASQSAAARRRAVQVAAARRRRNHRTIGVTS